MKLVAKYFHNDALGTNSVNARQRGSLEQDPVRLGPRRYDGCKRTESNQRWIEGAHTNILAVDALQHPGHENIFGEGGREVQCGRVLNNDLSQQRMQPHVKLGKTFLERKRFRLCASIASALSCSNQEFLDVSLHACMVASSEPWELLNDIRQK